MAFSKTRSMTPLSRSSVLMVRSVTCFISWLNICGVNLLRILRTFRKSSCKKNNKHITECAPRQQSIAPFPLHIRESNDVINYSIIAEHLATTTCFLLQNKAIWNMHMVLIRTEWKSRKTWDFWVSESSMTSSRFMPGFQAFSAVFSCTSLFTDTFVMILRPGGRRRPTFSSWGNRNNYVVQAGIGV